MTTTDIILSYGMILLEFLISIGLIMVGFQYNHTPIGILGFMGFILTLIMTRTQINYIKSKVK